MAYNEPTPLCKLAAKYGTDKCPQINHSYTPFYYRIFSYYRLEVKKVLELGIGHPSRVQNIPRDYQVGAGLRMWRDFFPNAQIYGADILAEAMFEAERIRTFLCDEREDSQLAELIRHTGPDLDIVIDDALHARRAQINACQWLMPRLRPGVIYIIEDVNYPDKILRELAEFDCRVVEGVNGRRSDKLIMVRHKR